MSIAYSKRKKAIRDEKRRRAPLSGPDGLDKFGHIPKAAFSELRKVWLQRYGEQRK